MRGCCVALVLLLLGGCQHPIPADEVSPVSRTHPNILIILADDQGWGDLSLHGNPSISTPRIDALARDGAQMEHFYVSTVCSPTRAELLTGRYYPRGGVSGTSSGAERLNLDERTLAEVFKAAGYVTGAFGKWHNGSQPPYHPNSRGFDEFYGFTSGHWAQYFDPPLDHNGQFVTGHGYLQDDLTDRAMAFMEAHRDRPVLTYLAYNTPHSPMQVPDTFWERAKTRTLPPHRYTQDEDVEHTRAALAMVENLDWNVGRVLDQIDRLGLANDTIVLYFSDNGPNGWRWNGDMKGRKGSIDEGGVRSPLLVRWPGQVAAGARIPQIAAAIDLLPTLGALAGVEVPADKPLDGISLAPLLRGTTSASSSSAGSTAPTASTASTAWPDRRIFSFSINDQGVSVRTQRHRLDAAGALFDMEEDPGQRRDVSAEHAALTAELRADAARMAAEVGHGAPPVDRPFTVGYDVRTWLPARDGVPHGGIARSSRHPNASYFTAWSSAEASVTWDVEVHTAGEYQAEVYYAVPAGDVGASVQLAFLDAHTRTKVTEAHDPPLVGAADDRTPRIESYTKAFRPLSLGRLHLESRRAALRLSAPAIPGAQAWEVSGLMLIRVAP